MSHRTSLCQIVNEVDTVHGRCEVVAAAEGDYDTAAGRLRVSLEAFLRPVDLTHAERHLRADWLPRSEAVEELVPEAEATEAAREMFISWSRRVRRAMEERGERPAETGVQAVA